MVTEWCLVFLRDIHIQSFFFQILQICMYQNSIFLKRFLVNLSYKVSEKQIQSSFYLFIYFFFENTKRETQWHVAQFIVTGIHVPEL